MSETAILAAARAAISTALPQAKDWSDDPANIRPDKLDAFVVTVTRDGAAPASMGSGAEEVQLTIEAEVFGNFRPSEDGREVIGAKGEVVRAALRQNAALLGLLDMITGSTFEVDLAAGDTRLARATVGLSVQATF